MRSQAVRGDAAALTAIYERHHQALYRYCRSILHDDEEARDALQSTMAKALAALRDEQRDFEVRPWLFRIAHNEAISRVRRRREVAAPGAIAAASTDTLAQTVEDRERLGHLRADLLDLPERQRAALVLRELSGLSHEEIAGVLDSTARAVKQTIFEARVALQECAEGRAMLCADVQRALSDGDGRILRGRKMRAHVRTCRSCRQFKAALAQRRADLAVLAPALPASAGAALLGHVLPGAKVGVVSSAGTATSVGGLAGTVATKAAIVAVATATVAGGTTAVRSAIEPSHGASSPAHVAAPAAAAHSRAAAKRIPAGGITRASAAHRRASARTHHSADIHAPHAAGPAGHAATTAGAGNSAEHRGAAAGKAKGKSAHGVAPGRSNATAPGARGKSQAAHAHKSANAATPVRPTTPSGSRPRHPVTPGGAGGSVHSTPPASADGVQLTPPASADGAGGAPALPPAAVGKKAATTPAPVANGQVGADSP